MTTAHVSFREILQECGALWPRASASLTAGVRIVPALGSDCDDGRDQAERMEEEGKWTLLESSCGVTANENNNVTRYYKQKGLEMPAAL